MEIYELLFEIKKRPILYIKKKSLKNLDMFLSGYYAGCCNLNKNVSTKFDYFGDFVDKYLETNAKAAGWAINILRKEPNDEKAFDVFFELLDIFLKEYELPEKTYAIGTVGTQYESRLVKEIHYTNHGYDKLFKNPHEHNVKWLANGNYYFDNIFEENILITQYFPIKMFYESFESTDEFCNYLIRGGELEFALNNKKYSIIPFKNKIYLIDIKSQFIERIFYTINDLLYYEFHGKTFEESILIIEPYFRRF